MDEIQQNIIFFSIISIGLISLSLFFFMKVFNEYKLFNFIIAIIEFDIGAPSPDLPVFFFLSFPPQIEIYSNILALGGIILLIITFAYLFFKNFDWNETWMRYSFISLLSGIILIGIGFIFIVFKRQLIMLYMLLTLALDPLGYISFFFAPYDIIDSIIVCGMGIISVLLIYIWILHYPSYY
ncbi:MAG: hypothetical protein ACTSO9_07105 [Candidatus Helarchaeota archaeon]